MATWPEMAVSPEVSVPARLPIGNSPGTVAADDEGAGDPPVPLVPAVLLDPAVLDPPVLRTKMAELAAGLGEIYARSGVSADASFD